MESDLVELVRPHYKRDDDEGRTFIPMALQDTADIEPTEDELRMGTRLRMRYSVTLTS
jgi:hypothetical protein